ncbi:hypothetical protein [Streptomyces sp. AS02]|uniref:hypothetical protein n=1 Tax=Streptomyces sp. AS02 TaxID=2938946 RepID=UPI0020204FEC|nr:hypothetical protein [Streptomyces sp. AS02]MCL8016969.1 hypothetical protein [Streptomyces sp. AS02]
MSSTTANGWAALEKRLNALPKPTRTLALCADPDVRDRYQTAVQVHARADEALKALRADADKDARTLWKNKVTETAAELQAAKEEYDAATVTLTFQALERERVEELLAKHPANEEDEEKGSDFHFDTFAPELIAAASVDGMPVDYAANALKTWHLADSEDLWAAAWSVQRRKRSDLGKG